MPFSSDSGKNLVDRALLRLTKQYCDIFFRTNKILDVGPGSGTYAKRYKSTLLKQNTFTYSTPSKFHWHGVEIWEPYIAKYDLRNLYDKITVSSGQDFLESTKEEFDICFLGDIVEHVDKETAVNMVKMACDKSRLVIISIPIIHYPQDEYDGNPYEAHVKDDWSHAEVMESFPHIKWYGVENEIGVYFCSHEPNMIQTALAPQIGVYGICKNEMMFIDRFYESIKDADFISLCDTGSTDGTLERLAYHVEQRTVEGGYEECYSNTAEGITDGQMTVNKIFVSPWRFDDARNVALSLVPEEVDMCISIDTDELMPENWYELLEPEILADLRTGGKVLDRYNHRFKSIWDWDKEGKSISTHWHERIHSRRGFLWKLPVHEVLYKCDDTAETMKWLGGWEMVQKPDTSKNRGSYLKMLEISVVEDPKRWKSWSFLGGEYLQAQRYDDAINAYKKALACPDADVGFLMMLIARVHQTKGDLASAVVEMEQAAFKAPTRELAVYTAELHFWNKNKDMAGWWLHRAQGIVNRSNGYSYDASCWDEAFDNRLKLYSA